MLWSAFSCGQIGCEAAHFARNAALCLCAVLLTSVSANPAAANNDTSGRIVKSVDTRDTRVVRGNLSGLTKKAVDEGRVDATLVLDRVTLVFKPSPEQQRALDTLLAEQQDPSSPNHQKWLTPDEFASRFGMSEADLGEVRAWLNAQGLSVQETSRSQNEISFRGTAAQIETAFLTEIRRYRIGDRLHYANATEPSVPAAFSDSVLAIRNLTDFRPQPRLRRAAAGPHFTSSLTGNHFVAPDDFATIYNVKALYDAGYDGTGQRIAVIGQTALGAGGSAADIDAFRAASGLPAANLEQVLVPGTGNSTVCSDDVIEAHLDVEWSGAVARNATIVYVYTGVRSGRTCATTSSSVWDALQYAVTNNLAPVISTSYGACEAANGSGFARTVRGWMQQANAQGQTITAASGDLGAADCEPRSSMSATSGFAVDVPAAIPEVTGVGGTEFQGDLLDPNAYWSDTNNERNGSATQYISEVGWNDTALSISFGGGFAASGGGASRFFSKPSWQTGTGVPSDGRRDVPDLALAASPNHDGYLICSEGSCVDGFRDANLFLTVIGGTSAAAPSLAGILALINQGTGSNGLGNINPRLYALASSTPAAFYDIKAGSNIVPCTAGSSGCSTQAPYQLGFSAGDGYDQVTGLGSIDAFALADSWASKVSTTTSLATSDSAIAPGASVTFTATVAPLSSGQGSLAGGQVQFAIDGSEVGTPLPVAVSGGAWRAAYTTSALPNGTHSVGAEFLGNLVYLASAAAPVTTNVAEFSLSPSPANLSLSAGGLGSSIITVASDDGFAGAVDLSCTPPASSARIQCALSPASLTLSSGDPSQSAILTITTTAAASTSALPARRDGPGGARSIAVGAGNLIVAALLASLPVRRRRRTLAHALALLLFVLVGASCGGGGGGGGGGAANSSGTPLGSYAITVSGTSGSIARTATVALTVQ